MHVLAYVHVSGAWQSLMNQMNQVQAAKPEPSAPTGKNLYMLIINFHHPCFISVI